jgi:hypothetical protein
MEPTPKPESIRLIEQLRADYIRAQAQFATVIQELEAELSRMRDNEKVPQDLVDKKDAQIETLIRYNNRIEDLFNVYKLSNLNLHIELTATHQMLWQAIKSDKPAFDILMRKPKNIPS